MWTSILSGLGGSILGGLFGASSARSQQRRNMEFEQRMAREQWERAEAESQRDREFQERMSSTSYRRAMEDMRAAGLNPILAYSQGGASSPSGRGAQLQAMHGSPGVDSASAALAATSAIEAIRNAVAQRHLLDATTIKSAAEADKIREETRKSRAQADITDVIADPARRIRESGSVRSAESKLNEIGGAIGARLHEFVNEDVPGAITSAKDWFRGLQEREEARRARERSKEVAREIRRENRASSIKRR